MEEALLNSLTLFHFLHSLNLVIYYGKPSSSRGPSLESSQDAFKGNGRKESTDTPYVQVRRLVQTLLNAILLKSRKKVSLICPMVMENQESGIAQRERPHSILK